MNNSSRKKQFGMNIGSAAYPVTYHHHNSWSELWLFRRENKYILSSFPSFSTVISVVVLKYDNFHPTCFHHITTGTILQLIRIRH